MDLIQLKYFQEAAAREHITQAAEALHITQPTLSKVIARLEDELGCQLFNRDGKKVRLTEYGKALLKCANQIQYTLDNLNSEISDLKDGASGKLTVGSCFPPREPPLIWDIVADYILAHPKIEFSLMQFPPDTLRDLLTRRKIDIALTSTPLVSSIIHWIPLADEPMGVIISGNSPLAQQDAISVSQLSEMNFLCNDLNTDEESTAYQFCKPAGFTPKLTYVAGVPHLIGKMVSSGQGVSIISKASVENQVRDSEDEWEENIVFRPLVEDHCQRHYGIAINSGAYLSCAVRDFLKALMVHYHVDPEEHLPKDSF